MMQRLGLAAIALVAVLVTPMAATAHCDRVNGPVAKDAREALASGDFETVAIWVGEAETPELRQAFEDALPVWKQGAEARELAERFFMSEAVRLHRTAEGLPFTGLIPASPVSEDIALAEKALESGELEPVLAFLSDEVEQQIRHWFDRARATRAARGESLEAGRAWADAYVKYVTFIHGLYQKVEAGPAHGVGD